jgi:ketosteroid isomerase-like protein
MNSTDARNLAMEYIRRLERNDLDGALSLTTPEARFWTPGPGEMNRQQMRAFFEPVGKMVEKIVFTLDGSTVEGDRVALELRSEAKLTNGRDYRNRYHFLFILRGDKIAEVREYADSAPAQAAFF